MNNVQLLGRLVAEPKIIEIKGKDMASFTIATGYGEYTEFTDCIAFEKSAELIKKFCHKGDMLGLVGRLQTKKYTDREGKERKSTQVVVQSLTLTSSKNNQQEQTSNSSYTQQSKKHNPYNDFDASEIDGPKLDITSDDLPF
jgi:single-strand DNA-binding protein